MKTVLRDSHIYTNATSTEIRMKLSNLDTNISTVGTNIKKFNVHAKTMLHLLLAKWEMSMNLLDNLFKGYKMIFYRGFIKYIKTKEDNYEEGE